MNQKEKILESWIMVEHLSEGDINLRDTKLLTFQYLKNDDFYDLFKKNIKYLLLFWCKCTTSPLLPPKKLDQLIESKTQCLFKFQSVHCNLGHILLI